MTFPRYTTAGAVFAYLAALAGVGAIAFTAGPNPHLARSFGFDLAVLGFTYLLVLTVALLVLIVRNTIDTERAIGPSPENAAQREFEYQAAS